MAAIYFHAVLKVRNLRLKYLQGWFLREFLSWKTDDWLTSPGPLSICVCISLNINVNSFGLGLMLMTSFYLNDLFKALLSK